MSSGASCGLQRRREDERTFAFTLCYPETPFHPTARYRFEGDTMTMSLHPNVGWDRVAGREFVGLAEA